MAPNGEIRYLPMPRSWRCFDAYSVGCTLAATDRWISCYCYVSIMDPWFHGARCCCFRLGRQRAPSTRQSAFPCRLIIRDAGLEFKFPNKFVQSYIFICLRLQVYVQNYCVIFQSFSLSNQLFHQTRKSRNTIEKAIDTFISTSGITARGSSQTRQIGCGSRRVSSI